jgi:hypothetical protein
MVIDQRLRDADRARLAKQARPTGTTCSGPRSPQHQSLASHVPVRRAAARLLTLLTLLAAILGSVLVLVVTTAGIWHP